MMLAVQAYRETPINARLPSPAELLFGRRIKAVFPIRTTITETQQADREVRIEAKSKQQLRYDLHAKTYQDIQEFQRVMVQTDPNVRAWKPAVVVKTPGEDHGGPRSYTVQFDDGSRLQRNRVFLKETLVPPKEQGVIPPVVTGVPCPTPDVDKVPHSPQRLEVPTQVPSVVLPATIEVAETPNIQGTSTPVLHRSSRRNRGVPPIKYEPEFIPKASKPRAGRGRPPKK
jgi:hypothetical protein